MSGLVSVVVGGQFGSEGKGAVTGALALQSRTALMGVRVAGPNAGHSVVDPDNGQVWALRQIPVVAVTSRSAELVICQGSEINPEVLQAEIKMLDDAGYKVTRRLRVDRQATVIEADHISREIGLVSRVGSTGKGIGAARADRLMRQAKVWGSMATGDQEPWGVDTQSIVMDHLRHDGEVLVEGTQGFGLGLHAGYYPKCTSSDCRWYDFTAMVGIPPNAGHRLAVWVVLRTYPIRVAGESGPMYRETSWEALTEQSGGYIQPERTTVTQRIRRVGQWDPGLARRGVAANGVCNVALTFVDYWWPKLAECTDPQDLQPEHWRAIKALEQDMGAKIGYLGTGRGSGIWL